MSFIKEIINNQVKNNKKAIKISLIIIVGIILLVCIILFFINKIPSKYYGTYIHYYYLDGERFKSTFEITPLSIKLVNRDINGQPKEIKPKYYKNGKDLIVEYEGDKSYLIVEDDCLYIESNKDITLSKESGLFYWNEKSNKADLYEIDAKADEISDLLETVINTWSRELIYESVDSKVEDSRFYILSSDEETDKTDLNSYKVVFNAAKGDLSLYYDRKEKKLKRIYFSGIVSDSLYGVSNVDKMNYKDIYDSRALLLACMFFLDDTDNLKLSIDLDSIKELSRKNSAVMNYDALFMNKTTDEENEKEYRFYGSSYDIDFNSHLLNSYYTLSGVISWNISLK